MWDNNTPLQLLQTMPKVLEEEHLKKLQMLLEADKYKNQLLSGADLCGTYAPFCEDCNKETKYPCAVAYVNYLKAQGTDIEIATDSAEESETATEPVQDEETVVDSVEAVAEDDEEVAEVVAEESVEEQPVESTGEPAEEQTPETAETEAVLEEGKPEEKPEKTRIRIAIARKKTIL